ncbi:MAG: DUF1993 domain-containing protein [Gammaproteobacteria bacterium]
MSYTIYRNTIPQIVHMLGNLQSCLKKGDAYAEAKKIDESVLVTYRLYPDMFPLSKQVQIACDIAKGCGARLSGLEAPKYEDNETTLGQLIERIDNTQAFLKTISEDQFQGAEEKAIELKLPNVTLNFNGADYVNQFVLPNVYFHVSIAYAILRHVGVELGKMDYLGKPPQLNEQ